MLAARAFARLEGCHEHECLTCVKEEYEDACEERGAPSVLPEGWGDGEPATVPSAAARAEVARWAVSAAFNVESLAQSLRGARSFERVAGVLCTLAVGMREWPDAMRAVAWIEQHAAAEVRTPAGSLGALVGGGRAAAARLANIAARKGFRGVAQRARRLIGALAGAGTIDEKLVAMIARGDPARALRAYDLLYRIGQPQVVQAALLLVQGEHRHSFGEMQLISLLTYALVEYWDEVRWSDAAQEPDVRERLRVWRAASGLDFQGIHLLHELARCEERNPSAPAPP